MTMDNIFDRAHDLLDKAQEKVATATSQAAWQANQTLIIKNLEGQLTAVQAEIDRLTVELGQRTYQAWKARTDDPRIPSMCGHLDDLFNRRAQTGADLNEARAATYDPNAALGAWQAQRARTAPPPTITQVSPPPPVQTIAPPPQAPPPQPAQYTPAPQPAQYMPPQPAAPPVQPQPAPTPRPAATQAVPPVVARPAEPPRPAAQPRECPNCGHFVPANTEYCPSCGLRVT